MQTFTLIGAIGLCLCAAARPCSSSTEVYRCQQENGGISYQQFPCRNQGKAVEIKDYRSGWSALRPGERDLLNSLRKKETENRHRPSGTITPPPDRERTCRNRRRQLDEIRTRLRRGYTLQEGGNLHRERDNHRNYLHTFCR